jgi:tRNA (uracil-5-)-methyltransferase TRM9
MAEEYENKLRQPTTRHNVMRQEIVQRLLDLNRAFYDELAVPFAESRAAPQPGFHRLMEELPQPCPRFLDVGCGDGRLGRFLHENDAIVQYTGVDFSTRLLAIASKKVSATVEAEFHQRDLSQKDCLAGLGQFDAVACLAVLQHIPGRANRLRLLREIRNCLTADSPLILSTWQFMASPRLARKVQPWRVIGVTAAEVEPNDYLLTWKRGGFSYRYVALIDAQEVEKLAQETGLRLVRQFRSDGKEGDLNLYSVLRRLEGV